jgi:single-strand DNA-binding protein
MVNLAVMLGNLTTDPELKYSKSGAAVCGFSVALNSKYKSGDDWKEEVSYIQVTAFGKTAENCGEFLHKGSKVLVQGRLKQDRWDDADGKHRSKVVVIAGLVQFLDGKKSGGGGGAAPAGNEDGDIPF